MRKPAGAAVSESAIYLKLDRILAGQESILERQTDQDASIEALTAGLSNLVDALDTQRELLARLAKAMSAEQGEDEVRDAILAISQSLKQIQEDSGQMVTMLSGLGPALSEAAHDAVRIAMGDGVDIPVGGAAT